jgi:arsenate reductase (thioredoxin)
MLRPGACWRRFSELMANVLFVCLHNAGRSQMSEALFKQVADGRHQARSAGTSPADRVNPTVIEAMRESDINLTGQKPKPLTDELGQWADVIVTMGCGDQCPVIPGKRYLDWELPDPSGQPLEEVRKIRDRIAQLTEELLSDLDRRRPTDT